MIDVHSHIIYGVDDGSKSLEQSLEIIKESYNAGFDKIIATPHYIEDYYEVDKIDINNRINTIKQELKKINCPIEIIQGNEIYITENINQLIEDKKATSINDNKYVLFELPLNAEAMNLNRVIYQILSKGRIPILAHPERYPFVQKDPNVLIPLIEDGVIIQSNFGSIVGQYKKSAEITLKKMLEHNMVHLLGSDVHRPNTIYSGIDQCLESIEKIIGKNKLEEIVNINPEMVIRGETIEVSNPIPIKNSLFKNIFKK